MTRRQRQHLFWGLAMLAPNITGFLAFMLIPLVMSLALAFTNWDITRHNIFRNEPLSFVGVENFSRLLKADEFWQYLGNTLFLMLGLPISIAGSLGLALLLNKEEANVTRRRRWVWVSVAVAVTGAVVLSLAGAGATAMTLLLTGLFGSVLVLGLSTGATGYRTLVYLPAFTSGVAVLILWQKLFMKGGPIDAVVAPVLQWLSELVRRAPAGTCDVLAWALVGAAVLAAGVAVTRARRLWESGEMGSAAALMLAGLVVVASVGGPLLGWLPVPEQGRWVALAVAAWLGAQGAFALKGRSMPCPTWESSGTARLVGLLLLAAIAALLGMSQVVASLPSLVSRAGESELRNLVPPEWLGSSTWSRPSFIVIGFWASVGANNMLLFLAGLSNVPPELYEAAEIDGARRFQKFWHVTWPQLAPTTFFIIVMSVIGGLQGGVDMARTLTQGGPAGSTTTLGYYIYKEGFEVGRLGYASAVSWTLFVLVLLVTMVNWRFGNRYVNE